MSSVTRVTRGATARQAFRWPHLCDSPISYTTVPARAEGHVHLVRVMVRVRVRVRVRVSVRARARARARVC